MLIDAASVRRADTIFLTLDLRAPRAENPLLNGRKVFKDDLLMVFSFAEVNAEPGLLSRAVEFRTLEVTTNPKMTSIEQSMRTDAHVFARLLRELQLEKYLSDHRLAPGGHAC